MSENYVINGGTLTSLLDYVTEVQGAIAPPPPLQSDYLVPGKNAAVAAPVWYGPKVMTVQGVIVGTGATAELRRDSAMTKLRTFTNTVYNGGSTYAISRQVGGVAGTATARYLGGLEQVAFDASHVIRVSVDLSILDGNFKVSGTALL